MSETSAADRNLSARLSLDRAADYVPIAIPISNSSSLAGTPDRQPTDKYDVQAPLLLSVRTVWTAGIDIRPA